MLEPEIFGEMFHCKNSPSPAPDVDNPTVFLDVSIKDERVGRVIILLRKDVVPRTAENFRALCTGEKGIGICGKPLHFKGAKFHKAISQFMVQGGDIINKNGSSGESIYGKVFEDENFILPHTTGAVSMANHGKSHTNSSQFFITTVPCSHLDGKNVVFGQVLKGLGIFKDIEKCRQMENNQLIDECVIDDCGEILPGDDCSVNEKDIYGDIYPPYPLDSDIDRDSKDTDILNVIKTIKNSGNSFFSNGKYKTANRKYKKAIKYILWASKKDEEIVNLLATPIEVLPSLSDLKLSCLLNLAATELKLNNYREVINICDEVLYFEPMNVKALFRRGNANMHLNNYNEGLKDLSQAKSLSPTDKSIIKELKKSRHMNSKYVMYEKKIYKKMMTT